MFLLCLLLLMTLGFSCFGFLIPLSPWFFFLWVTLAFILSALILILFAVFFVILSAKTKPNGKFKHFVLRTYLRFSLILLRTPLKIHGKENLPKEMGYTVYGNHKSNMDVIYAYLAATGAPTALGKKSLFQNWFLKDLGEGFQALPIDRENDREAIKSILKAIKNIKEYKLNYIIFPEGGVKSRDTEEMVNLRAGAYKVAVKANAPIVPMCILGSSKLKDKKWYQKSKIELYLLKPLMPEDYKDLNTTEIGHLVEQQINECVALHEKN